MIKAENSEVYNTARAMRQAAMLLLLRRTLTDAVTFCAFENIRGTDDNPPESPGVRKLACKLKKKLLLFECPTSEKPSADFSYM